MGLLSVHTLALMCSIATLHKNLASTYSEAKYKTKQLQCFIIGFIFEFPFPCMQSFPEKHYPQFVPILDLNQQQQNINKKIEQ